MHVASLLNSQAPSIAPKITNYRFFLICLLNCLLITLNPIFLIEFILYMSDHELVIHLIFKKKKKKSNCLEFFPKLHVDLGSGKIPPPPLTPHLFKEHFWKHFVFHCIELYSWIIYRKIFLASFIFFKIFIFLLI